MSKIEKIIEKFNNSNAGQKYEDCEKVILYLGYTIRKDVLKVWELNNDK